MERLVLFPGDRVADAVGLAKDSDHRQILRMFVNTIVWGAVATGAAIWLTL